MTRWQSKVVGFGMWIWWQIQDVYWALTKRKALSPEAQLRYCRAMRDHQLDRMEGASSEEFAGRERAYLFWAEVVEEMEKELKITGKKGEQNG